MKKPSYQLSLALDLPEPDDEQHDAQVLSENARQLLNALHGKAGAPRWLDDYLELYAGGWPWRVAAYIAWASTPKMAREPRSQNELAKLHLGLSSDRVISDWRKKNPLIDQMVHKLQGSPVWKHRAEIFTAMVAVAIKPDAKSHQDRKMALKIMGDLDEDGEE